ncbi:MAG: outer membrane beta-barrel protein, partial [Leeuwenhoekiella sp.]
GENSASAKTQIVNSASQKSAKNGQKSGLTDENSVAANEAKKNTDNTKNDAISQSNSTESKSAVNVQKSVVSSENLAETKIASTTKSKEDETTEKSLFDLEKEKQADELADVEEEESKRWGVSPLIAPVYYNSFGGSGIDPQFQDNSKSGEVNMSYGLQVSYAVSEKLTIRTGVNKVDLSYNTNNIGVSTDFEARTISSINYDKSAEIIELSTNNNRTASFAPAASEIKSNNISNGKLHQSLGYYEVPMEIEYAIIDKKVGLQVIGGVSTLFLNANKVSIEEGDFTTPLGSSNSLNDVSFSTNIGLGIDYKISKMFQFNLEPMFKYQINSYTNTVSDFKPYYMGLYTGVSIKF